MESTAKQYRDKKKRREAIKKDLDTVLEQLAKASESAKDTKTFKAFLASLSKFHHYSWRNLWLIQWQKPGATLCAGKKTWWNKG